MLIKDHVIFRATGEPNINGDVYSKKLKVEFEQDIPITLNYDPNLRIGTIQNPRMENGCLIADLNIEEGIDLKENTIPGICFSVDPKEEDVLTHATLISVGMNSNNVDENIKPIK
jgi:hypothetical protein